jgi:hypothetical protein
MGLVFVLAVVTTVTTAGQREKDVELRVTYRDTTPPLVEGGEPIPDGVRSDGLTSLTGSADDYVHGVEDNALVIIQTTGSYRFSTRLDTRKPLRRRLCLDFGTQVAPIPAQYCADVLIGMHGDGRIQDMLYGEVLTGKRLKHSWDVDGYEYRLHYGGDWNQDGEYDSPSPLITCTASPSPGSACTAWTMESTGHATLSRVKILSRNKLGEPEFIGNYDMPFAVFFARK